ncbi:MAG: hypothetical protein LQ341_006359 [Variospora aurantia]|nr:MAG: hypothetical protein LQ341_006359 [Variospora aurantia]
MPPPPLLRKRSSSSAQLELQSSTKRSRTSFQSREPEKPLHTRVHRRIITQDAGRDVYEAKSLKGIINGFLGAIHGHESLLEAGILHRDISIGNIMLTKNEEDGFLIDLDLAIRISNDHASGAPSKTGTKVFMAIGALYGEPHSFMHDLESFFWVLFWVCIHYDGQNENGEPNRRVVPQYENWNYASTGELAKMKLGQIQEEAFDKDVDESFTSFCRGLIPCMKELYWALFPREKRWQLEDRSLYGQVKKILRKARESIA